MSKSANSIIELNKIEFDSTNNRINFSTAVYSNGSPIADATAGSYANSAFDKANTAFIQANAAFNKANSAAILDANTTSTGFFAVPIGNTAQRPANAANGSIRYNTTLNRLEAYMPSAGWLSVVSDSYPISYILVAGGGCVEFGTQAVEVVEVLLLHHQLP